MSSFTVLVCLRVARRLLLVFFVASPRRKTKGESTSIASVNKRSHLLVSDLYALLALLAGRGGEGERGEGLLVAGVGRCWGVVVSACTPAISKRRRCLASAIFGQRDGLAMLDCDSGYYFLQRRIFSDLSAAAYAPAARSGSVPGGDRNGRRCRFSIGGDEQGLDRFFAI
jgi:hypothetical protein